jgi:hypothetical protein
MVEYATIQVRRATKKMLEAVRRPGETFDHALRRTLDAAQAQAEQAFFDEVDSMLADRKSFKPLR